MFSRGRRPQTEKPESERQKATAGEDWRGETPPESPPEVFSIPPSGVSINTTVKTSTISITIFVIHFIPLIV